MSRKQITLEFNSEIKDIFNRYSIPMHDGMSYLVCLHYGLDPSFIPPVLERKILATKIVTRDYENNQVKWNVGLFEETETGFEWIGEWMDLFKNVNPERRGVKADVLKRMKKFFMNNPSVRKEDVFNATNRYLESVSNPMYCKKSHKFIYEIDGTSMLADYVEQLGSKEKGSYNYNDDII
jgi:hypothetical protein